MIKLFAKNVNEFFKRALFLSVGVSAYAFFAPHPGRADEIPLRNYHVRVPKLSATCDEQAAGIAASFTLATGLDVVATKCASPVTLTADGADHILYSVTISYRSADYLEPANVIFGSDVLQLGETGDYDGLFTKYDDCVSAIDARMAEYQRKVGLQPIAAFCAPAANSIQTSYYLEVDGFGKALKKLYSFDPTLGAEAVLSAADLTALGQIIIYLGGDVVGQNGTRYYYYADYLIDIKHLQFATFATEAACTAQLDSVTKITTDILQSKKSWVRCVKSDYQNGQSSFALYALWYSALYPSSTRSNDTYYSMNECLEDRARVIGEVSRPGQPTAQAICSRSYDNLSADWYQMVIYQASY